MNICLVTPAPAHSRKGNRVTADRWARILRRLGHRVVVEEEYGGRPCDLMVALHARRSFASVKRFRRQHPGLPLVLALTGTDLYGDIHTDPLAQQSIEMASRLIVLQPMGIAELPEHLRHKARVIYQSAKKPPGKFPPRKSVFEVGVFGHLRPVKDPFRTAMAARLLPASSRIQVVHVGGALSEAMEKKARAEEGSNPRYRWLEEIPRWKALRVLARCRLLVLSSKMEGGANVLSEAIAASVPALASRIPGSIGILGPDYPGYFPVGDTQALAKLLERVELDAEFLRELQSWYRQLKSLVDPARERQSWQCLLQELAGPVPQSRDLSRRAVDRKGASAASSEPRPKGSGAFLVQEEGVEIATPAVTPTPTENKRFTLIDCSIGSPRTEFAREVKAGLTSYPKRLSCRFFYDREGSELFEAICELQEYYLMRVERGILEERAGEIAGLLPEEITLVELGSGSAAKTRILIEEFLRRQRSNATLRYVPVDISRTMLEESSQALLNDYPSLEIIAIAGEYNDCLPHLNAAAGHTKLILWLGSNVGNLDRPVAAAFLRLVRGTMSRRDRLLIGIDLRKDRALLQKAYDDPAGVTAQFNRNILARINRELGGHFDLNTFEHRAVYDERMGRIEMYLVSTRAQRIRIEHLDLEVPFAAGEAVHTENSYKYSLAEIEDLAAAARLQLERQWLDAGHRFSVSLLPPTR